MSKLQFAAVFLGVGLFWFLFSMMYSWIDIPGKLNPRPQVAAPTSAALLQQAVATRSTRATQTLVPTSTPTAMPTSTPTLTPRPTTTPTPTPIAYNYYGFEVGSEYKYRIPLKAGEKLDGYFTIAENKDLEFWIEDPLGNKVYNPGKVVVTNKFSLTVQNAGVYNLVFHNSFLRTSRTVGLYWRVEQASNR